MRSTWSRRSSRDNRAIITELAQRLDIKDNDDRTGDQWLRELARDTVDDFEAFRENGVARFSPPQDAVAFDVQIRDPENHHSWYWAAALE